VSNSSSQNGFRSLGEGFSEIEPTKGFYYPKGTTRNAK
jgi:hypothetical protein